MTTRSKARPAEPQPLPGPERAELQRQGRGTRGKASANPMHEPQNLPTATGESPKAWEQRQEAWRQGHDAENGRPEVRPPPLVPQEPDDGHE